MILSSSVKDELISVIKAAVENGTPFPLEMRTSGGGLAHKISIDKQDTGLYIAGIKVDGTIYRIYMI